MYYNLKIYACLLIFDSVTQTNIESVFYYGAIIP
jgi:hypothetical protein